MTAAHRSAEWRRSGLEESGARTAVEAERRKSIVFEGAERPSLIDFSGAGTAVSPSLHSRDLFGSFFDLAKNERPRPKRGSDLPYSTQRLTNAVPRTAVNLMSSRDAALLE